MADNNNNNLEEKEAESGENSGKGVGFLYRTMVERDPSKRRVKPVEKHLQLLDFADLDDSSDDSDFKIGDHEQESDNDDSGESSAGNEEASEEEEESKPAEVIPEPPPENVETTAKALKVSVGELIERAMQRQSQISTDGSAKKLKVLICSVCLGDISEEDDEIVECDCCGVSVHEGCYGISDTDTVVSTVSSSSTEPWFCDACKAGNTNPTCELCPNPSGIFKETDVGKWVHLVCALYIPGVAFGDVDKLTPVTLFEMPYSRWGAKPCALCEDERFARTGVCISCDAGMCRNYFHVTCAQREGLLSEASTEEDIADPFFAYCKLHADKNIIRSKRRNWLALQSQAKERKLVDRNQSEEKARIERKLAWHREKYLAAKVQKAQPWVPTQKMPRLLTTSPSACRKLLKKAELLGMSTQTHITSSESMMDVRRKWHVPPAFSVEFVSYYLDRNNRMITMQRRLDELLQQNSQLQEQEQSLREKYEKLVSELEELKKQNTQMQERGMEYWKIFCDLGNKKYALPEVLKPKRCPKSPSRSSKRSESTSSLIFECGICHKSHDQHQLAKCDSCQLHYHLACLDPPLSRMPKKTKSQGWQCSECDKTEEDDLDDDVDPNAPRKLRDHVKGPLKFVSSPNKNSERRLALQAAINKKGRPRRRTLQSPEYKQLSEEEKTPDINIKEEKKMESDKVTIVMKRGRRSKEELCSSRRRVSRRALKRTILQANLSEDDKKNSDEPQAKMGRISSLRKSTEKDLRSDCFRCKEVGDSTNIVRCDECKKCFHFQCLNPPVKKNPKQRGYTWYCEDCDSEESYDNLTDDENDEDFTLQLSD
ncbi:PHD finger protein 14 isoform X2 [Centruroides vittatus]|uniref:PHD finger protein 14 isoform X2 n=1 Tax=Centruroides vittatus TaxID=120091 RepID=UPI00351000AE